jgi:ribonuclease-3
MKNPDSEKAAEEIQKMINYIFRKKDLLREALTHSSYANESGLPYHNDRMEFLGDAVL